jgi:hypothetical protein
MLQSVGHSLTCLEDVQHVGLEGLGIGQKLMRDHGFSPSLASKRA